MLATGDPGLVALARQAGEYGIEHYESRSVPWPCGVREAGETPELMLGTAGIGYYYLRLHDPVRFPPVTLIPTYP
jgi:hypothetical protein